MSNKAKERAQSIVAQLRFLADHFESGSYYLTEAEVSATASQVIPVCLSRGNLQAHHSHDPMQRGTVNMVIRLEYERQP